MTSSRLRCSVSPTARAGVRSISPIVGCWALAAGAALLGASNLGCNGAQAHQLSATKLGDVSYPIEPPGSSAAPCGDGALTDRGNAQLDRLPYLQGTSDESASLLFTLRDADAAPEVVELTTPSGELVERVEVSVDPAADDGRQWFATLSGLEPETDYCYSVVGFTRPAALRTAPRAGAGATLRFIVFGDSGDESAGQLAVRDQMSTFSADLLLHTGDIAYESGSLGALEATFFDVYEELLQSVPVFPTTGNHDYETAAAEPFRQVFALPENGGPLGTERWYSYDFGDVHFVALDTEQRLAEQARWLERDLSESDRPWKIAYFHRPPYSSGKHGSDLAVRRAFVPLFERHGVQVVFSGHDHNYERTVPINGVTYVVTGGGGRGTRSVGHSSFTAFSEATLHFIYGTLDGSSLVLHAIDATGQQFDSVRIQR